MNNQRRYEAAETHLLRIEQFVDIAAAIAADCFERPSGALDDLVGELLGGVDANTDQSMVPLVEAAEGWNEDPEELAGVLGRKNLTGFAIQFATPVYHSARKDCRSYSWGHCYLKWVYGDTLSEAWAAAIKWSKQNVADAIKATAARG